MFRVSLNGSVTSGDVVGVSELDERLYFDDELGVYLNKLEGDLQFHGSDYNTLRDIFLQGVCSLVDIDILDIELNITYSGRIFINDIEWNLSKRVANCKIVSDKFIQMIDNNKSIKVQLGVGLAKDETPITTVLSGIITLLNPPATSFITREGYRIFDVYNELIQFMSNGQLTFVSDYFDFTINTAIIDNPAHGFIMTGKQVRDPHVDDPSPLISFVDFHADMNALHNLAGVIEGNTFRIEPKEYFRQLGTSATISNVNDITQELATDKFYSLIKMGSAKVIDNIIYLIKLSFNGFQQEEFFLQGQCNTKNELDLRLKTLITDTNIIQGIQPVANGGQDDDSYDDDIVLIKTYSNKASQITPSPLQPPDYYYNDFYSNKMVSNRWENMYPFSIIQLYESINPLVWATMTADTYSSYLCNDDSTPPNFDTGGDYQLGTIITHPAPVINTYVAYFEAPSDMVVSVEVNFRITASYWKSQMWHIDNLGELQSPLYQFAFNNPAYSPVTYYPISGSQVFYMPTGTRVYFTVAAWDTLYHAGATFKVYQLGEYGGVYKVINTNHSYVSKTGFEYPTDYKTWEEIKAAPYKSIDVTYVDGGVSGRPLDIKRNIGNSRASYELYQRKIDVDG